MTPLDRARAYLAKLDPAVSGQGGHNQTFIAACKLVEFGLSESDAWELLWEFNCRCSPPWSEKDLRHKLRDAFKRAEPGKKLREGYQHPSPPPPPWKPTAPVPAPAAPSDAPPLKPARYDVLPADLPEPLEDGARMLLRHVFRPDDGVAIAKGFIADDDPLKDKPDDGIVLTAKDWLRRLDDALGKPTNIWSSSKGAGVFIRVNPLKMGGSKDADVTDFRHALLEWDNLSLEEQWSLIQASRVPCAAVIYSGGKSVHAWVKIEAKDRAEYDERVRILHAHFAAYGQDTKNKNPSRFSRLPGATRHGRPQELLGINLGLSSFTEWLREIGADGIGKPKKFGDLIDIDTSNDPNCVIGFDHEGKTLRYLCKGKSAWLLGPSGIGKSSLIAEFAVGWARGLPVFGIKPSRPLRSVIIQAENDDADLAEMVQGIAKAYDISPWTDEWDNINDRVWFRTETRSIGPEFCNRLHRMIDADRPDIVWIDPLLSFAGIDVSKQDQTSHFLRQQINPVLEATGVVLIGVHHTGKPKGVKETRDWTPIDWAYSGLGSSELVNWARAVMLLRPVDGLNHELKLAKRGRRAGATHPDGEPTPSSVWIRHSDRGIRWEQTGPPEEPAMPPEKAKKPAAEAKKSKSEQVAELPGLHAVLRSIPDEGESSNSLGERIKKHALKEARLSVSEATCRKAVLDLLEVDKKIQKSDSGLWKKGPNA